MNQPWADLTILTLRDAGVRDVVISPGSRSTPLVLACIRAELRRHAVIDERSAAFFALGMARQSNRPTALVCTSGTAAAHYLPAVIEASHSGVPLVIVTANRPPELMECSAPQTIDQSKLFGPWLRAFVDVGMPDPSQTAVKGTRRRIARALDAGLAGWPGPVHIDVPARKPLEPTGSASEQALTLSVAAARRTTLPQALACKRVAEEDSITFALGILRSAERGLVIAGPGGWAERNARQPLLALLCELGWPVLAETSSQLRAVGGESPPTIIDGFELIVRNEGFVRSHVPDAIVQIGAPPASPALLRMLDRYASVPRLVVAEHGWPDPHHSAFILRGGLADSAKRLASGLHRPPTRGPWTRSWLAANTLAWDAMSEALDGTAELDEGSALRAVGSALPERSILALGNSLPLRVFDWVNRGTTQLDVVSQRGVNGIDGLIAGAAGSSVSAARPVTLILGDVSFAHDVSSLAVAVRCESPLAIVVVDNGGGRIFEHLPLSSSGHAGEPFEQHWITPPALDFDSAARAFGVRYAVATTVDEIARCTAAALAAPGPTVVHAICSPSGASHLLGRAGSVFERARLDEASP